jgi:Mg2+/Co2+ transporter CorB
MIDADLPPAQVLDEALQSPHTRLPLYRSDPENIVGVLHVKDLLQAIADAKGAIDAVDIAAITREPWYVPETTSLKDQLALFLKRKTHFALVVDEYGALEGLVTLEDILEEIVGEIEDEYDVDAAVVRPGPDGVVMVDGSVTIRELNRAMNWDLPDEEAVTVAGLLIHKAEVIPDVGQSFLVCGHQMQVTGRKGNRITSLQISPPEPASE